MIIIIGICYYESKFEKCQILTFLRSLKERKKEKGEEK